MTPERAARNLANIGAVLLALVVLLRVISFTDTYAQSRRKAASPSYAALPYLGDYTFSPSGAQAGFHQGWVPAAPNGGKGRMDHFYLDLRTGQFTPGSLPAEDMTPFVLRDNHLWLAVNDGFTLSNGSPENMRVDANSLVRSPDRTMMAFIAWNTSGTLFVLSTTGKLDTLVQAEVLSDPTWSPDGQALAFIMRRAGEQPTGTQVFRIQRDGTELRQLTQGDFIASSPRWSPDGKSVAYLRTPVSPTTPVYTSDIQDIAIVDSSGAPSSGAAADGSAGRMLTAGGGAKRNLTWIAGTRRIAYTTPSPDWLTVEELYEIDAAAESPQSIRFYPPVTVESLECPGTLPRGGSGTVRITLENSGPQPVAIPLVLRAGEQLIPLYNVPAKPTLAVSPPPGQPPVFQETSAPPIPEQRRQIIALDGNFSAISVSSATGSPTPAATISAASSGGAGSTTAASTPGAGISGETFTAAAVQRTLEWPAQPVPGLTTYLSAIVLPDGQLPLSEKHCVVRNTYFGLPNLPYLPSVLPLTIAGMLLAVPWLRHQNKLYWWALWLAIPLLIAVLIILEIQLIPPLNI